MENKQKLLLGLIAAIIIVGIAGGFIFFQSSGTSALTVSNLNSSAGNNTTVNQDNQNNANSIGQSSSSSKGNNAKQNSQEQQSQNTGSSVTTPNPQNNPGECPKCGGKRYDVFQCSFCKGTGIDPYSLKNRPVSCRECGGDGLTNCYLCTGGSIL